jgi:hypothetical protein
MTHSNFDRSLNLIQTEVTRLTHYFEFLWWGSSLEFPQFQKSYLKRDHNLNTQILSDTIRGVESALKRQTMTLNSDREPVRTEILKRGSNFAKRTLGFEERHIKLILDRGFVEVVQSFARQAREVVPSICDDDIYQASRNVLTMNFMQLLLGKKVQLTPSIFAYSLLYPLTDNYLDDPSISMEEKQSYGARFRQRLMGKNGKPGKPHEIPIWECIALIEDEYPRKKYPLVYASLLGIHDSQQRSLDLLHHLSAPYEVDVLGLTFEKGGAAVLADGYLVAGALNAKEREFMFAYGAFTQLMDDLEDTKLDLNHGVLTVFSQVAGHWPLDTITNRLFHFGRKVFKPVENFKGKDVQTLQEMIWKCIDPLLIDFASRNPHYYSKGYLKDLENHFPFIYRDLSKNRKQLEKKQFNAMDLVKVFAKSS